MDRTGTPVAVLLAIVVGILKMPLDIYDVHVRNVGTVKVEPWRTKLSTGALRVVSAVRELWQLAWCHRRGLAVAGLLALIVFAPSALEAAGVSMGIAVAQLEADLRTKQTAAKTLLEATMRECQSHVVTPASGDKPAVTGRAMTDAEKGAIQAILDEGKAIKLRIDRVQGDASMNAAIEHLTAGMAQPTNAAVELATAGETRSLGAQFIADQNYRNFIRNGGHRRSGTWTSPAVDLQATTLTEGAGSGGPLVLPDVRPGILPLLFKRLVVADLIAPGTTDSNLIQFMKETTFTNAAAPVLEGGLKPESTLVFAAASSPVQKIAHWIPVTEEMLEDFAQTQSIIDARLRLGLDLTEEDQLLNGNGTPPQLLGLMNLPGLTVAVARGADSTADAIFKQVTAIATTVFVAPDGIVMNPINWQTVQLTKNAAGNYLGSGPWAPAQPAQLWGLPVAVTPSIVANTALVGGFRSSAQIFRRGGVRVESSNSHASFFVNNLVAIRAEERLALAAYREAAFGKVTGLN
jgi:HK97 family phage major capsid protein